MVPQNKKKIILSNLTKLLLLFILFEGEYFFSRFVAHDNSPVPSLLLGHLLYDILIVEKGVGGSWPIVDSTTFVSVNNTFYNFFLWKFYIYKHPKFLQFYNIFSTIFYILQWFFRPNLQSTFNSY